MQRPIRIAVGIVWAWAGIASFAAAEPPDLSPDALDAFQLRVRPFFESYCTSCHGGAEPKADLALDAPAERLLADPQQWAQVLANVQAQTMPPDDAALPTADERKIAVRGLRRVLSDLQCGGEPDPGRVTLRRLNRREYRNTVRDLLGIDFAGADDFPTDDVGYGFDNIGDVLSLPPLLMEKYLAAAERIASTAIVADGVPPLPVERYERERIDVIFVTGKRDRLGDLPSNGEAYVTFEAPAAADYLLRVQAHAQQAGDEVAKMSIAIDQDVLATHDVRGTAGKPDLLEHRVTLTAGSHRIAAGFLNDYWNPEAEKPKDRDRNLFVSLFEVQGPLEVALRPMPETHRRIVTTRPASDDDLGRAAREVIEPLAARALRRPVAEDELARLTALVQTAVGAGDPFERGVQLALEAILVSPSFLFLVEQDPQGAAPGSIFALGDYELAARLSYFLWSSLPDDELRREAAAGTLRQPERLAAQVSRMLADVRAQALVENFAGQWLQIRNLETLAPDLKRFPNFDGPLRSAMRRETEHCFAYVMRENRSVTELLDADYTFVNEPLAKHYGLEPVEGDEFRQVSTTGTPRGGILTQAAVLAVTSNPTRTSPVKRGRWVLEQILGAPAPPPPEAVMLDDSPQAAAEASLRQRLELHRANSECAVCHDRMDPLGFGLENFDAVGAWRDSDGDFPIDASGTLPGGTQFTGPMELKAVLRQRADEFRRCLADKLLTYALGRGLETADQCALDEICDSLAGDDRFHSLVLNIVRSRPFQLRRAAGDQP